MKRRSFFRNSILSGLALSSVPALLSMGAPKHRIDGKFVHMVFFFLKDTTPVGAFKELTAELMEDIDLVKSYHVGEPAGTPREVVDNSYTVCLVATFNSKEDQDAYQVHPVHLKYVNDHKDKWHKVVIYDSWAG